MPATSDYPSLELFTQEPRHYQTAVVDDSWHFVAAGLEEEFPTVATSRRLYASPTGTGKGSMILLVLKKLRDSGVDAWCLTPTLEVVRGFLQRTGVPQEVIDEASDDKLTDLAEAIFVTTPVRHQNRVFSGERQMPEVVLYDEAHHAIEENSVSGNLFAMAPDAIWLGFTATPYRGTPAGTRALREAWGEPVEVMDLPAAICQGFLMAPECRVVPLLDDDKISVVNGKFSVAQTNKAMGGNAEIEALADLVLSTCYDGPSVVVLPSTKLARQLHEEIYDRDKLAYLVLGGTKPKDRAAAYDAARQNLGPLITVKVLTEGVDLPWLETMVDSRPTTSPVEFVQRLGRILRPYPDKQPRYITTCRNLERFCYLLGGVLPPERVKEAQEAFPVPTKRDAARSLGFEALARFKRIPVPLANGLRGSMFCVHDIDAAGVKTEWCVLLSPLSADAITATRSTLISVDEKTGERTYTPQGKWTRAKLPDDLQGFASSPEGGSLSKKQRQWWERAAGRHGLDPEAATYLKRRQFAALPVLSNVKEAL